MDDSQKQIPDPGVFEKLGVFYLGAERDSVAAQVRTGVCPRFCW